MKPLVITTALLALTGIADAAVLHGHRHRHRHRFSTRDNTVTDTITNGTLTERTVKKLTVGHGTVGNGRFGAASGHGVPGLGHGRKQEGEGECDPVEDVLRGSLSLHFQGPIHIHQIAVYKPAGPKPGNNTADSGTKAERRSTGQIQKRTPAIEHEYRAISPMGHYYNPIPGLHTSGAELESTVPATVPTTLPSTSTLQGPGPDTAQTQTQTWTPPIFGHHTHTRTTAPYSNLPTGVGWVPGSWRPEVWKRPGSLDSLDPTLPDPDTEEIDAAGIEKNKNIAQRDVTTITVPTQTFAFTIRVGEATRAETVTWPGFVSVSTLSESETSTPTSTPDSDSDSDSDSNTPATVTAIVTATAIEIAVTTLDTTVATTTLATSGLETPHTTVFVTTTMTSTVLPSTSTSTSSTTDTTSSTSSTAYTADTSTTTPTSKPSGCSAPTTTALFFKPKPSSTSSSTSSTTPSQPSDKPGHKINNPNTPKPNTQLVRAGYYNAAHQRNEGVMFMGVSRSSGSQTTVDKPAPTINLPDEMIGSGEGVVVLGGRGWVGGYDGFTSTSHNLLFLVEFSIPHDTPGQQTNATADDAPSIELVGTKDLYTELNCNIPIFNTTPPADPAHALIRPDTSKPVRLAVVVNGKRGRADVVPLGKGGEFPGRLNGFS